MQSFARRQERHQPKKGLVMKRILSCLILLGTASLGAASPAIAQYYYPYAPPPPPRYYQPNPYAQPNPWGGGYYYQRPVPLGNVCVTSRGSCRTRMQPANTPCGCNIPGFGPKRGAIIAQGGW
jgi:hypothetical protein